MQKFQKAIIHVGGDKAGSTAIQSYFNKNRESLLREGIAAYPPGNWHAELGSVFADPPKDFVLNKLLGISDDYEIKKRDKEYFSSLVSWLDEAPSCEFLIFSYEGFVDLKEDGFSRLFEFCRKYAESIEVYLYVRPPLSYAVSAMSQRVKSGKKAFTHNSIPISPYKNFLTKILASLPASSVRVRKFDKDSLISGDVVIDFLDSLGISHDSYKDNKDRVNESLSHQGMLYGETLIDSINELVSTEVISTDRFFKEFGRYLTMIPGKKIKLTEEQIATVQKASAEHKKFLEKNFQLSVEEAPHAYIVRDAEAFEFDETLARATADIFAYKYCKSLLVSDGRGRVVTELLALTMERSETTSIFVTLINESSQDWMSTKEHPLKISYHIFDAKGRKEVEKDGLRTAILEPIIRKNSQVNIKLNIMAPLQVGEYQLIITPLQERHGWFESYGFTPKKIDLTVI